MDSLLSKEINRLLSKGMPNIYLEATIEKLSKLWFSGIKKFVTRSVFEDIQLTQISLNFKISCCNLRITARERKKNAIFVPFILPIGIFFKICVLSQCIVHWMHFQNIHTFTYQKTLLHALLLLVFKIVESLRCTLHLKIYDIMKWEAKNYNAHIAQYLKK